MHISMKKQTAFTDRLVNETSTGFGEVIKEVSGANYVQIVVISF